MSNTVGVYISAAPGLRAERSMLAKAITEIPTSLAWRIGQTPLRDAAPDLNAVARADVHILLLGADIQAPVGLEWQFARRAGKLPALFARDAIHTQAAEGFVRELAKTTAWRAFKDAASLRTQVLTLLAGHLLEHAGRYELSPTEIETLAAWRSKIDAAAAKPDLGRADDAADSSVILSLERFTPSSGTLLVDSGN